MSWRSAKMADNTPIGWVRERLQRNDLEREPLSRIVLPIHMSFPGARVHLQKLMLHTESTIPGAQVSPVHGDSFYFLQKGKGEKIEMPHVQRVGEIRFPFF